MVVVAFREYGLTRLYVLWDFVGFNDSELKRARCERGIDGFRRGVCV